MEERNYRKSIYNNSDPVPDDYYYLRGKTTGFARQGHVRKFGPPPNMKN